MYELHQIMRQKEDKFFAKLLIRLREGNHTKNDIDILSNRIVTNISKDKCKFLTYLFVTNALINLHNNAIFLCQVAKKRRYEQLI